METEPKTVTGEGNAPRVKRHWLIKFMRRGFEPPMPFGKTRVVIAAYTRAEAIETLKRSDMLSPAFPKVTASATDAEVSYHFADTERN